MNIKNLNNIAYKTRLRIHRKLSQILEKVSGDRDGRIINRIEKDLTRFIVRKWNRTATFAKIKALQVTKIGRSKDKFTTKDGKKVLKRLDKAFKNIENRVKDRVISDNRRIYRINKKRFVNQFRLAPKKEKRIAKQGADIKPSFGIDDAGITENLSRLENIAIGDHYPNNLKSRVATVIATGVIARGLNKFQAGIFLEKELTLILGGAIIDVVPSEIVAQGQRSVTSYFKGVTATHVNMARNFGQVQAMEDAGITRYQIVGVPDDRQSLICQQLDGRIFELRHAKEHMDSVLDADDVSGLQKVAPWRRDLSEFNLSAGRKLDNASAAETLAKNGMSMPPYHFRCRTDVVPA